MKTPTFQTALTCAMLLLAAPVVAQSQGDWTIGFGRANVNPKSDNGVIAGLPADVDDVFAATFTFACVARGTPGLEFLAFILFDHAWSPTCAAWVCGTRHLTATQLNHHFPKTNACKPHVGSDLTQPTYFDAKFTLGTIELDEFCGISEQSDIE